nr:MAG TPA: hypothetical protein [Caudoviricetes sp.]
MWGFRISNGRIKSIFQVSLHLKNVKVKYPISVRYNHNSIVFNAFFSKDFIFSFKDVIFKKII